METEKDVKIWSDDLIPFPHLAECTFNETVFQSDLQKMLYTPSKLLSELMFDNERRIVAGRKHGRKKVAPLYKHPEVIAGNDFVMSYLTDQRRLLSVERTKFYDVCKCRVSLVDQPLPTSISTSNSDNNKAQAWTLPQSSPTTLQLSQSSSSGPELDLQKASTEDLLQVEENVEQSKLENCENSVESEDLDLVLFLDQSELMEYSGAVQSQVNSPPAVTKSPLKELESQTALSYLKAYGSDIIGDLIGEISDSD